MNRPRSSRRRPYGAVLAALVLMCIGGSHSPGQVPEDFPDIAFDGSKGWINSKPMRLRDLKGKIVLLDFWTYCCINCHHVLPDLAKLEQKYKNELVVIGVHTAKFDAERSTANIRKKVEEYRIKHPVINDADQIIWSRFGVQSWPTLWLIDANNRPIGQVAGEGQYAVLDEAIGKLVKQHKAAGQLDERPLVFFPEDDSASTEGGLLFPGKILADKESKQLFIADTGHNRIIITDLDGKFVEAIGSGGEGLKDGPYARATFNRPQGMCLFEGKLYVADTENHAIRAVDFDAKQVTTVAGTGEQSHRRSGSGPARQTGLNSPWDLIPIPGTRSLAVAMAGPHQIWRYDLEGKTIGVFAGTGQEEIIDGPYAKAAFAQPSGLATDGKHLFVADSEVSGVRSLALAAKRVDTIVGVGLFGFGDRDGEGSKVRLQHCLGLAYGEGGLYIADSYNNKIKVCDPATKAVETLVGAGPAGADDNPPKFYQPGGLSVLGSTLYVADTNNHAIRKVHLGGSHKVTTLDTSSIKAPAPPPRKPTFPNATVINVPEVKIAPGKEFALDVTLDLPRGFKLNDEAPTPIRYLLEAPSNKGALDESVPPTGSHVEPAKTTFKVPVPLAQPLAAGQVLKVRLSVSSFICKSGASAFCTFQNVIWNVPVRFADDGASKVSLTNAPPAEGGR